MIMTSGSLKSMSLADILTVAGEEGFTGIVTLKGNVGLGSVTLRAGKVVDVREPRARSRLGRTLVRKQLINEKELQAALKIQKERGKGPLGEILIEMKIIERKNLNEAMREVLEESLVRLLGWEEGLFRVDPMESVPGEEVGIAPVSVLAARSRQAAPVTDEEWVLNIIPERQETGDIIKGEVLATVRRLSAKLRELKPKEIVLLVEDEVLMRQLFKDKLENFGFEVDAVESPRLALDKLADYEVTGRIPVIVSDLIMPTISGKGLFGGLELLEEVQKSYSHIPVLVTTAYPDATIRRRALFMGATYYINKPDRRDLSPDKLESSLSLFIEEVALCIQNVIQRHEISFEREQQNILREQLLDELIQSKEELQKVGELVERDSGDIHFLRETSDRMVREKTLGSIAEQILAFARKEMDRRAILLVRRDSISGYYGGDRRPGGEGFDERIKTVSFPLSSAPLLEKVIKTGQLATAENPREELGRALFTALGEPPPQYSVVLPMIVQGITVALLYGDVAPGSPPPRDIDSLRILLNLASLSLEIAQLQKMIHKQKVQ